MKVPFLDLKIQYKQIEHEVMPMITEAMANGAFVGNRYTVLRRSSQNFATAAIVSV